MYIYCYELIKLPSFKNIKLIAGESGLDRKISWVYVLQTPSLENWVYGEEVLFVLNSNDIYKTLEDAVSHCISCVVVLKDKNNKSILTPEAIQLANKENFPLFEMDYNIKIIDVTRDISTYIIHKQEKTEYLNYFFYKIFLSDNLKTEDIEEFVLNYGFSNEHNFLVATIHGKDVSKLNDIKSLFHIYVSEENVRFLSAVLNGRLVIIAYGLPKYMNKAKQTIKSTFSIINKKFSDSLCIGIGNISPRLRDIRYSYIKSIKALYLCRTNKKIIDYEELGFPRLLLNTADVNELKDYSTHILGKILEYDKNNTTFFLETIKFYVLCNGNINKSANKLHIHRNTCIYRISKIKELFQLDLDDAYIRADILNAFSIYDFLENIDSEFFNLSHNTFDICLKNNLEK